MAMSDEKDLYFTDSCGDAITNCNTHTGNIYMIRKSSVIGAAREVVMVDSSLKRPYGIAYSAKDNLIYVTDSDENSAVLKVFSIRQDGKLIDGTVLFDARKGAPNIVSNSTDSFRLFGVAIGGGENIFLSCTRGVLVLNKDGFLIGFIETFSVVNFLEFSSDGKNLYMTSESSLLRIPIFVA